MDNKQPQLTEQEELAGQQANARNKKLFIIGGVGALALILGVVGFFLYRNHQSGLMDEKIGMADIEMNDSIQSAMYKQIADEGSYKANERAQLMTAIKYYNDSNYTECLKYLDKPSVSSPIIEAGIYSLKGDCYVNTNKLDQALEMYQKALKVADENPVVSPFILCKEANVYASQKKYDKEYECYETVRRLYPNYLPDIEKYYERAKARAGK